MKELKDRIVAGERAAIAKAITLVESSRDEDIQQSHELISQLIKSPGKAIRVGFSGPPGVGKSTFIESFGTFLVNKNFNSKSINVIPNGIVSLKGGDLKDELKDFNEKKIFDISEFFTDDFFKTKRVVYVPNLDN